MPLDIPSERDVPTAQWQDTSPYVQLRDAAHRVVQALANRQSPQPLTYNSRNDLCNSIRILRSIIVLCDRRTLLEQPARPEPTRASLAEIQRLQDEVQRLRERVGTPF